MYQKCQDALLLLLKSRDRNHVAQRDTLKGPENRHPNVQVTWRLQTHIGLAKLFAGYHCRSWLCAKWCS